MEVGMDRRRHWTVKKLPWRLCLIRGELGSWDSPPELSQREARGPGSCTPHMAKSSGNQASGTGWGEGSSWRMQLWANTPSTWGIPRVPQFWGIDWGLGSAPILPPTASAVCSLLSALEKNCCHSVWIEWMLMAWDELPKASNTKTSSYRENQLLADAVCAREPRRAEPTPAREAPRCHLSVLGLENPVRMPWFRAQRPLIFWENCETWPRLGMKRCQNILVAQMVKNLPVMQENQLQSMGREDPLEKGMATHSSIIPWRIQREPGRLQLMGFRRVRHDRAQ